MNIRRPTGIHKKVNLSFFLILLFVYLLYFITLQCMLILWIMFTFYFVTLFISFQIQYYVNVLIRFKQKEVFNVEKPITNIYS